MVSGKLSSGSLAQPITCLESIHPSQGRAREEGVDQVPPVTHSWAVGVGVEALDRTLVCWMLWDFFFLRVILKQ